MCQLRALLMRHVPSPDGPQADVLLIEADGREHQIRCLCRRDGTTVLGIVDDAGGRLAHLEARYGPQVIWALTRQMTLGTR